MLFTLSINHADSGLLNISYLSWLFQLICPNSMSIKSHLFSKFYNKRLLLHSISGILDKLAASKLHHQVPVMSPTTAMNEREIFHSEQQHLQFGSRERLSPPNSARISACASPIEPMEMSEVIHPVPPQMMFYKHDYVPQTYQWLKSEDIWLCDDGLNKRAAVQMKILDSNMKSSNEREVRHYALHINSK